MTRLLVFLCVVTATIAVLQSPAEAHHGWSSYRTDVEMAVTVTELKLGNPHDRLLVTDAEGTEWQLLLAPPARNRRFGFTEDTLSVGDVVDIFGQRHSSRREIKVHCIFVEGEAVYTYRYNSGTSSLKRRGRDELC